MFMKRVYLVLTFLRGIQDETLHEETSRGYTVS
jgi:hypothetical protein